MHTKYVDMLMKFDNISYWWDIAAIVVNWLLLAGFVMFPGTFTSWETSDLDTVVALANIIQQLPLYVVAWACTGIGGVGMLFLWWKWRKNYFWLKSSIFLPGLLHSLAGMILTIANIYGAQRGIFTQTSKATLFVTIAGVGICGLMCLLYRFILIRRLKKQHEKQVGEQHGGKYGEASQV
ncbi:hypothetical protein PAXINDRAFT_86323 [Paxillus involutus ATCC 200175]|uniref:Uncharacterized protein n=1 Tax=Paxillus involutus ATCC 200175 TaxID=664439 RepID=A0A0C9SRA1_PAXIN|nr:hypothetical protein PAXINDRAFT_86323 [Paxillus involutus ATCC 200175]